MAVAGADTQGVQLQYLAREILVEAAGAIDAGNGVGPDGNEIIEIDQHCWVALDREQHFDIAPEDVRPDCLAFIAARHVGHLFRGHAEMVRPEPDEALGKADLRAHGGIELGLDLLQNDLPFYGGDLLGLRWRGRRGRVLCRVIAHLLTIRLEPLGLLLRTLRDDLLGLSRSACLKGGARGLGTGEELRIVDASDIGTLELGEQRAARIGCNRRDRARTGAQAEPMQGQRGISCGVIDHGAPPVTGAESSVARGQGGPGVIAT